MDSYLVCYDISNPKRLRKVAKTCEDFGYRKQLSVFLVRVSATDFVRLRTRLYDIIDLNEDQVLFLPLTESGLQRMEAIGRVTDAYDKNDVVMIL
jgi:CRISPR-associated protein Cas2